MITRLIASAPRHQLSATRTVANIPAQKRHASLEWAAAQLRRSPLEAPKWRAWPAEPVQQRQSSATFQAWLEDSKRPAPRLNCEQFVLAALVHGGVISPADAARALLTPPPTPLQLEDIPPLMWSEAEAPQVADILHVTEPDTPSGPVAHVALYTGAGCAIGLGDSRGVVECLFGDHFFGRFLGVNVRYLSLVGVLNAVQTRQPQTEWTPLPKPSCEDC